MLECVKNTKLYSSLALDGNLSHAYLFYSNDQALNNQVALTFAKTVLCEYGSACGKCNSCKQFENNSHPDFFMLDDKSLKVEDISKMLDKMSTLPVFSQHKVFLILNAENVNERAQNKMLKSLEEPNAKNLFIMTSAKLDKILPTILSRVSKIRVPNLGEQDKAKIIEEYRTLGEDLSVCKNFETLSEMLAFVDGKAQKTMQEITKIFDNLNTTADIPAVVSSIGDIDKDSFFPLMQEMFMCALKQNTKFDKKFVASIALRFPPKVLIKCLELIDDAYKKLKANVNFTYILDNLLFNILKEKFYAVN